MKKIIVLLVIFFSALLLLPLFSVGIQTAKAQTAEVDESTYGLKIASPTNTTYVKNSLLLDVTAKRAFDPTYYSSELMYSLDGKANVTIPSTATFYDKSIPNTTFSFILSYTIITGDAYLSNLSEGPHFLTVCGVYLSTGQPLSRLGPAVMKDTQTIYFTISDGTPPSIEMLQIQNKTYQTNLPLNFSVDEPVSWMGYNLDGQANVTLVGNTTLTGLAYGSHSLVVYANDSAGNMGTTGNISFTVVKPESFPAVPITAFAVVAAVAVVSVGLLVYFKRLRAKTKLLN